MATFLTEESKTFNEYLLIPRLTTRECTPDKISLRTPLVRHKVGEEADMYLNVPFMSESTSEKARSLKSITGSPTLNTYLLATLRKASFSSFSLFKM